MSYILDALRRADAERERGAVPGIHAQPVPLTSPEAGASARSFPWPWIVAASGLALLLPLAWQWAGRDAPIAKAPEPAAAPTPRPAAVATPTPADRADFAPSPAPAPNVTPRAAPMAKSAPAAPATPSTSAARSAAPNTRAAPQTDAPEPARAVKAPATGSEELRVKPYRDLPDEVRRKLPKLVFGGSIHSDQASDRILIVNGQLLREGETAAPGVVLEQIKRQSAVFKSGDYRYEMSY